MKSFQSTNDAKAYAAAMFAKYDTAKSVIVHVETNGTGKVYDISRDGKIAQC